MLAAVTIGSALLDLGTAATINGMRLGGYILHESMKLSWEVAKHAFSSIDYLITNATTNKVRKTDVPMYMPESIHKNEKLRQQFM